MTADPPRRQAWVTLITNPGYVAGLLTVYRTLISVSRYPLIVMATDSLPQASRDLIQRSGISIVDVAHLLPAPGQHSGFDPAFVRLNDAWTKLRVFGLTEYDRLILIDSDMLFLRSLDDLFELELPSPEWIGAAPACVCNPLGFAHYPRDWTPANCLLLKQDRFATIDSITIPKPDAPRTSHLLNSGLVVLQPSKSLMDHLITFLNTSPTVAASQFADQDIIAEAFHGRWRPLPWWCNALKPGRWVHPNVWDDGEVRLIHYILDKPWTRRPGICKPAQNEPIKTDQYFTPGRPLPEKLTELVHNTPPQLSATDYDGVHAWWWAVYEDLLAEMKSSGPSSGWEEMDAVVRR
ncbi:galactinol synthase [Naematelia encephala]|uniref:Galactinol synthase n=1 Tax=Naematelia encephala TaxID=71784 RepID=A0A1Y2AZ81_9TREE|nr:galactinol synthase [Naematelia encephala]